MSTTPFPLPIMLDAADRKALRARAHHLDPVVMIGDGGLTRAVLDETDRALRAHELIKIRVLGDDREHRQTLSTEICSALGCASVQAIGKLLVLYRPRPIEDTGPGSRRGAPHVPKKRAATGAVGARKNARTPAARAPRKAAHKETARSAPAPSRPRAAGTGPTRSKGATQMKSMKAVRDDVAATNKSTKRTERAPRAAVGPRPAGAGQPDTEGKRTAIGVRARVPSPRGAASAATQGPARLQGRVGPARAGTRARAKKS